MTDYIDDNFKRALCKNPDRRSLQDIQVIYYGLHGLEALAPYRDSIIRSLCKTVRYERHEANDVLYYAGELATCWYILLSGSVFIDGSMFLPMSSFGKRTSCGNIRRTNQCFVLETSEMIVVDYCDIKNNNYNINNSSGDVAITHNYDLIMEQQQPSGGINLIFDDSPLTSLDSGGTVVEHLYQIRNRNSQSSDTSSAYSGSDTMVSVHSVDQKVDLSGLVESIVDSDEDDLVEEETSESLIGPDTVRECLEKDPSERTEDDIDVLLEFTQHLKAFTNMTLSIRRALCSVMVFAVVEKAGTVVMNDGEELDSWSVLINGHVEIEYADGSTKQLHLGDSFGILPTMKKLYHEGVMRTKCDDCQFVCITQTDYYRIQHQGEENIKKHQDADGRVIMITEQRGSVESGRYGFVVIQALPDQLIANLVKEDNSMVDPTYVEDFLLTFRTFIKDPPYVTVQLMKWFEKNPQLRDRVARVILLWINNHFTDFETNSGMMEFLEDFETCLEAENMTSQLQLLNIAYAAKSQPRCVILTRPDRDVPLPFEIVGGYDRGCSIYISSVTKGSKAAEIGLKRGDQILAVNGHSYEHVSHARAVEILSGSTHLSITVKANLIALKEVLQHLADNQSCISGGGGGGGGGSSRLPTGNRFKVDSSKSGSIIHSTSLNCTPIKSSNKSSSGGTASFMTLGPKKKLQKALMKMNILSSSKYVDSVDDSSINKSSSVDCKDERDSSSSLYQHFHSQPDLVSMCYDDPRNDVPEHVLKVYKPDQNFKYLLVHKETTAHEVVMLALQEFGMTDPSSHFCLCEVTVAEGGIIKQKRLPDQLQNLAERIDLSSRYYLKTKNSTETLVNDELAADIAKESAVHFLQLNAVEIAVQLTLKDFEIFREIESTEYVDDLFGLESAYGCPALSQFSELVNKEMFWVVTEVCSELSLVRRSKIIKQFIKIARQCKECKNFNSMFAIISGLGHGSVSRLRQTWEKLPSKYQKLFGDLQDLMDPSRNMSKYRQLVCNEQANPPIIPFYPIVKKDLTFIHLGNDTVVDGLINFEKLRMISKEIRTLRNMCSSSYDLTIDQQQQQQPSHFIIGGASAAVAVAGHHHHHHHHHNPAVAGVSTIKRRKKTSGALNPKKMFEESQMVRRVRAYLSKMKVISDEDELHKLSLLCEGSSANSGFSSSSAGSSQIKKRHPSPTLSTTSSASSASEGRKTAPKFGSASPQAVKKLLSLSEPNKTRPYQPRHPSPSPATGTGAVHHLPGIRIRSAPITHERSHSDTTGSHLSSTAAVAAAQIVSVDLSAESSSVTSLSNIPFRKTMTSGSITSSDSGHSTQPDSRSINSVEYGTNSPQLYLHHRRHSELPPHAASTADSACNTHHIRPIPPYCNSIIPPKIVAPGLHKLGRAHSHEGVTIPYFRTRCDNAHDADDDDDDDDTQVSAV